MCPVPLEFAAPGRSVAAGGGRILVGIVMVVVWVGVVLVLVSSACVLLLVAAWLLLL